MVVRSLPAMHLYGVSEDGTVWSKKRKGPGRNRVAAVWLPLKPRSHPKTGYLYLTLQRNDRDTTFLVHHLVARVFLGERPLKAQVNHKNGDKSDNSVRNLEYVTARANLEHAWSTGLIKVGKPKLTHKEVTEIRRLVAEGVKDAVIARQYSVYSTTIRDIRINKTWNTEGRVIQSAV